MHSVHTDRITWINHEQINTNKNKTLTVNYLEKIKCPYYGNILVVSQK